MQNSQNTPFIQTGSSFAIQISASGSNLFAFQEDNIYISMGSGSIHFNNKPKVLFLS